MTTFVVDKLWEHKTDDLSHRSGRSFEDLDTAIKFAQRDDNDPYQLFSATVTDQDTSEIVFHVGSV